jgi:hypothetical protein
MGMPYVLAAKQLRSLMDEAFCFEFDVLKTYEIKVQLNELMPQIEGVWLKNLYDAGLEFRHWLDDTDIRIKDRVYHEKTTEKIKNWYEKEFE